MIILAVRTVAGQTVVTVAPVTHTSPQRVELAIEIPAETKRRLGLDEQRSWIVASDLNQYVRPGVDLRPTVKGSFAYGLLPAGLFRALRDRVVLLAQAGKAAMTRREG